MLFATSRQTNQPAPAAAEAPAIVPPPVMPAHAAAQSAVESPLSEALHRLKWELVEAVISRVGGMTAKTVMDKTHQTTLDAQQALQELYTVAAVNLSEADRTVLLREVMHELFGFGPIQQLLDDPTVTEVMVNRADRIYAERAGKPVRTHLKFENDDHVRRIIDRIILPLGLHMDTKTPYVDARLPDGSRVNAVIPPVAIAGGCITIRKFGHKRLTMDDLIKFGALTRPLADFLKACVVARLNIIVAGGTGSGKTTLLNLLSGYIPEDERIVTIEDAAELRLAQDHVLSLESKKPDRDMCRATRGEASSPFSSDANSSAPSGVTV